MKRIKSNIIDNGGFNYWQLPGGEFVITVDPAVEQLRKEFHEFMTRKPKCECGSEKARTPGHSTWCPKYER